MQTVCCIKTLDVAIAPSPGVFFRVHFIIFLMFKVWRGDFFEKTSLYNLGALIHLGHIDKCPCPASSPSTLTVVHTNGVHSIRVVWCECGFFSDQNPRRKQLLRVGWFPASIHRPATVMTFDALNLFQLLTIQSKISFFDFFEALIKVTDNSGTDDHVVSSFFVCHFYSTTILG